MKGALAALLMVVATTTEAFNYCTLSKYHQLCGKQGVAKACLNTMKDNLPHEVTKDAQDFIVDKHNALRSKVALGKQPGQPGAANMLEMTWDDELARIAQAYANKCHWGHDCSCENCNKCSCSSVGCRSVENNRFSVGQNIYKSWSAGSGPADKSFNFEAAIMSWYDEVDHFRSSTVSNSGSSQASTNGKAIGHYTQIVWAKSNKVGCGFVMYEDPSAKYPTLKAYSKYVVCNYGPAGNYIGQPIYEEGPAGSKCPSGTTADRRSGLCK